jgi:DNA-binding MarR family transcriptional regulator
MRVIATRRQTESRKKSAHKPTRRELRIAGLSCLALNLRKTARIVSSIYDNAVRPAGIRMTQFAILATVGHNPNVSITGLAEWIDSDRTTAQRGLDVLRRRGWIVARKADAGNLRELALTQEGEKKLAEAYSLWEKTQNQIVDRLGDFKARNLLRHLSNTRKLLINNDSG